MSSSRRGDLVRQVDQLVGRVAHRGHDDDHVVTGLLGRHDALGDSLDAGGVRHRRAAVLLHDDAHGHFLALEGLQAQWDDATLRLDQSSPCASRAQVTVRALDRGDVSPVKWVFCHLARFATPVQ
jgi:hypothetical protein